MCYLYISLFFPYIPMIFELSVWVGVCACLSNLTLAYIRSTDRVICLHFWTMIFFFLISFHFCFIVFVVLFQLFTTSTYIAADFRHINQLKMCAISRGRKLSMILFSLPPMIVANAHFKISALLIGDSKSLIKMASWSNDRSRNKGKLETKS